MSALAKENPMKQFSKHSVSAQAMVDAFKRCGIDYVTTVPDMVQIALHQLLDSGESGSQGSALHYGGPGDRSGRRTLCRRKERRRDRSEPGALRRHQQLACTWPRLKGAAALRDRSIWAGVLQSWGQSARLEATGGFHVGALAGNTWRSLLASGRSRRYGECRSRLEIFP
jgi:hypothetical protein